MDEWDEHVARRMRERRRRLRAVALVMALALLVPIVLSTLSAIGR